jgi:hypothetical protein
LKLGFKRAVPGGATIDVFRVSKGRHVLAETRVAHFAGRTQGFTWNGRGPKVGDGFYLVRYRLANDTQRLVLQRSHGRWTRRPDYYGRLGCSTVRQFKLLRPVFGGTRATPLGISVLLTAPARVTVTVRRGAKVVKRYAAPPVPAGAVRRFTLRPRGLARGDYTVTLKAGQVTRTLTSRRL